MTIPDQARRYLAAIPGAISGQDGHDQTFKAACALVNGYGLSEPDALNLLREYNERCSPKWTERELLHKVKEAAKVTHEKPRNHLVSKRKDNRPPLPPVSVPTPKDTPAREYALEPDPFLPAPIEDGTRQLLQAAFLEGEYVRITLGLTPENGGEIPNPKESKATFNREFWLKKLDGAAGNPNKFMRTSERNGIYIGINPMEQNGSADKDVKCYRHVLVEWDKKLTRPQQWDLIRKSGLPCTAVIDSGGKSVHAWVRVDSGTADEYREAVQFIYSHFERSGYPLDPKNRNPSRYSRLAGCMRFDSRQELLALNIGVESFAAWRRALEAEDIGPCHQILELAGVDTTHDPNCVIGFREGRTLRYLCREKSAWIIGPSGIGKSTLTSEFAIGWALGLPVYGITPARPLKSLIIQAENDFYDLAEMVQGVIRAHDLNPDFDPDDKVAQINRNVLFKTEDTSVGLKFLDRLHRLTEREKPDVVWVDPLLSFAGIDVMRQDQVCEFLINGINPILKATGAVMIGIHHTGKIRNSKKEMESWTPMDFAYAGLGSSILVNWARAVLTLMPVEGDTYRLELAKRGSRAGATHPDGSEARSSVYLRHSRKGIRWEQVEPPEMRDMDGGADLPPKLSKIDQIGGMNLHSFLRECRPEGEGIREISSRLEAWLNSEAKMDASQTTCRNAITEKLIPTGKLQKIGTDKNVKYVKGPNA